MRDAGKEFHQRFKTFPTLIVVVLPEAGTDIYTAVKQCVSLPFCF